MEVITLADIRQVNKGDVIIKVDEDNHTTATVHSELLCDFCVDRGASNRAEYDGKTKKGPWAYMCYVHFVVHGVGLGLGRGQKLIYKDTQQTALDEGAFDTENEELI